MRILRIILLALALGTASFIMCGANPSWELVQSYPSNADISDNDKVDVSVKDGYIYIYTPRTVEVKVLSIVGQMISEKSLPAGVSRLKIASRGIYILKVGGNTMRVSI